MTVVHIPRGDAAKPGLFLAIQRNGTGSTTALFGGQRTKHQHILPCDQVATEDLGAFWVFGVVRNPWERMHSMWRWVTQTERFRHLSFEDWCLDFAYKPQKVYSPRGNGRGVNQVPQVEWLQDGLGRWVVDHVYRFEWGLPKIWGDLVRRGYQRKIDHTPKIHKLPPYEWRNDYTSRLIGHVGKLFAPDIREFGYSFA